jgi:hypothetical protein
MPDRPRSLCFSSTVGFDQVWLLNAEHLRNVPGRKADVADSMWIAELVEHGLVRPVSCRPLIFGRCVI